MATNQENPAEADQAKEKAAETPTPKPPQAGGKKVRDAKKPPSKFARFLRRLLWGFTAALVLFAGGMAVNQYFLQAPRVNDLNSQVEDLQADNTRLQDQVLQLQTDVNDLTPLEAENRTLVAALGEAQLHVRILSALKDVQSARIAVADSQFDSARLALTRTADKLEDLSDLLPPDNQGVVDGMLQRLELALDGLDGDPVAVSADLSVLANSLIQLENTLFTAP